MGARAAVRNTTWAELEVGDTAGIERVCSVQDLVLFAHVSGNLNPLMLPSAGGAPEKTDPVAPSMWVGSLVSAVLGNILPGPGTLYRSQDLRFLRRVHVGEKVRVAERYPLGHYRVPLYLRGKAGIVERLVQPAVDNEEEGFGRNAGSKRHYYRIAVAMTESRREYRGGPHDQLDIEVFETWLERIDTG